MGYVLNWTMIGCICANPNTEPIIRIYAESNSQNTAQAIAKRIMADVRAFVMQA